MGILSQPLLLIHIRLFRHQHLRLQLPPFNPDLRSAISPPSCVSALRRHLPIRPAQPTHPAPNSQPRPQPPRARTSTAAPRPPPVYPTLYALLCPLQLPQPAPHPLSKPA